MQNHLLSVASCQTEKEMKLESHIGGDPTECPIARLIDSHLDRLIAMHGLGKPFRDGVTHAMADILMDGSHNIIEPVASIAPRTRNLVIRFRISDTFDSALTRAAQYFCISSHTSNTLN